MARGKKKESLTLEEKLEQALVPVDEQPYEVPENWCWVRPLSLFEIEYGKGLSAKNLTEEGYPVFGANGQIGYYTEYMYENPMALMSCRGAYSGVMNKSEKFSYVTSNSLIISPRDDRFSVDYICYLFRALETTRLVSGSAQPQVTVQAFNDFEVPLPPLSEQQRIVEQINRLFSKLDDVCDKSTNVIEQLLLQKKSILYEAFNGKLTFNWRKRNNISKEITWKKINLIDALREKPRNGYSPKPVQYETSYKSMTLSATSSGFFKAECYKYIDEKIAEDSYLWLTPGDILIQRANSLEKVGTSAIYTGRKHEFIYPDLIMKLQVKEGILPEFIDYQLKTEAIMRYFRSNAIGTAGNMPKINQKVVSNVPIVLTTTEEQQEIVRMVSEILKKYDTIIAMAQDNVEKVENIKKTILRKAFRGKLGTHNPEEESSIELLKKILEE